MLLVVDANIVVGEALRRRERRILDDGHLELLMAESAASETAHELGQHVAAIARHGHLTLEQAQAPHTVAQTIVARCVTVVPTNELAYCGSSGLRFTRGSHDVQHDSCDCSAALASAVSGLSRSEPRIVGYAYNWTCGASVLTPCKRLS
jgi:hypothetical protein